MKGKEIEEKEEDRFWREKDVHVEIPDVLINLSLLQSRERMREGRRVRGERKRRGKK